MGSKTGIEWTDATWNPVVGCSVVSPGCTNCYAMSMAVRINRMMPGSHYKGTARVANGHPVWTGKLALAPEHILTAPLRWRRPRRIFVNSMGDLFHENVPDEWIDRVFAVMALAPQHTFQVLTKRSARMRAYMEPFSRRRADALGAAVIGLGYAEPLECLRWPLPNCWLGVSAEDQRRADERVPDLLATPAAVRFVSAEPLLGPIDFHNLTTDTTPLGWIDSLRCFVPRHLDWIIVGGESGQNARPMHPQWARDIRDQCAAAGVAFHFKQHGEYRPLGPIHHDDDTYAEAIWDADEGRALILCGDGKVWPDAAGQPPNDAWMVERVGKARAGRLLDGIDHDGMPA